MVTGLFGGPEFDAARRKDRRLVTARLRLLAEFFGTVAPDGDILWERLAIRLAETYVPGLRPNYARGPGRPSRKVEYLGLYLAVLELLHTTRIKSVANACQRLAKESDRWGSTAKVLEARFHETKRRILDTVPASEISMDPKTGCPLNCPPDARLETVFAFDHFRVRYGNMPSQFA